MATRPFRYNLNQIPYDFTVKVRNRFKGLDLVNRVSGKLWTEVCNIVQKVVINPSPRKRNSRRQSGYLRKLYKKMRKEEKWKDNHCGVLTHLELDILECEIKWALITMNKATGGDGIPAEQFKLLKYDAVKVLHTTHQQIWKIQRWPQNCKRSVFIPIPKKSNAKESSNYHTIVLISRATKVMLRILQARLQ